MARAIVDESYSTMQRVGLGHPYIIKVMSLHSRAKSLHVQWESLFNMHLTKSATHGPWRLHQSKGLPNMWSSLGNESVAAALSFLSLSWIRGTTMTAWFTAWGRGTREGLPWPHSSPWASSPAPAGLWAGPQAVGPHLRLDDKSIFICHDKVCHNNGDTNFDIPSISQHQ